MARKARSKSKAFTAASKKLSPERELLDAISRSLKDDDDEDDFDPDEPIELEDESDDPEADLLKKVQQILKKKPDLNFQDDERKLHGGGDDYYYDDYDLNLRGKNWRNVQPPVGRRGMSGNTALMWACQAGDMKVATVLLEAGADPKVTNMLGENALHLLQNFETGDNDAAALTEKLIAAGADVNAQNIWGATPLMMALDTDRKGFLSVAWTLLQHGADPYLKTAEGKNAFDVAEALGLDPIFIEQMKTFSNGKKKSPKIASPAGDTLPDNIEDASRDATEDNLKKIQAQAANAKDGKLLRPPSKPK